MLDILHYFFEEDLRFTSGEEYEASNSVRSYIYESMYMRPYKYKGESTRSKTSGGRSYVGNNASWDDLPDEFSPSKETKPFIPPTQVNTDAYLPFGEALEAPLK